MIDPKLLRDNFSALQDLLSDRSVPSNLNSWPDLDSSIRDLKTKSESIKAEKNKLSPEIAKLKREGLDASHILDEIRSWDDSAAQLELQLKSKLKEIEEIELLIPNVPHDSVPSGGEENNREEKKVGTPRSFNFTPRPHWEVGETLGILDLDRATKLSGARFSMTYGLGSKLERALASFMLDEHTKRGYTEVSPPYVVRRETMQGSGQLPKFEAEVFSTRRGEEQMFLIPTAEVSLCNIHSGEILDSNQLPKRFVAYTPCFRSEAGSYGRDVRGLIRLHQFHKVELVALTDEESSYKELEKLTRDAEHILERLELPYRRLTLAAGDMGFAASKTHDLEVWLPSQNTYREISSCSNTADFQGRRTNTRYRNPGDKPKFVHMLNGSGLAVGRTLVAILENYQQEDGSLEIPKALIPYMGGVERITAPQ